MITRVHQDDECLCEHIYANVANVLTNRVTDNPSYLVLFFLQKYEVDSASGDIHPNDDDSSSGSGSEHSCPQEPVEINTDVSHSESKSLLQ